MTGKTFARPAGVVILACLLALPNLAMAAACGTSFAYTGGLITCDISVSGIYLITAYGAQGAASTFGTGGLGASASGEFDLAAGTTLEIAVGGAGTAGSSIQFGGELASGGSGGGGGSFVTEGTNTPLVVAGGGGGAGGAEVVNGLYGQSNGSPGQASSAGAAGTSGLVAASGGQGGSGGTAGAGGAGGEIQFDTIAPASFFGTPGGGGGGFLGNGTTTATGGAGGSGFAAGLTGGAGSTGGVTGGFVGGGGGGSPNSGNDGPPGGGGGGGGGYSGGGGGGGGFNTYSGAGGGGGSFVDAGSLISPELQAGVRTGNGAVTLSFVSVDVPEPKSSLLFGAGLAGLGLVWQRRRARSGAGRP